ATYERLLERRTEVVDLVTGRVNAIHPVFVGGQLSRKRFFHWCAANAIGWPSSLSPRTGQKDPSLSRQTFDRMKGRHPFIRTIHEASKTVRALPGRTLTVDRVTGRHSFTDIPLGMATGRTSFKSFLLSAPRWMRMLAVPKSPEPRLVSVDFEAEEILIAAH